MFVFVWTEIYGSVKAAREAGVTGRLAIVRDGEYTWIARAPRARSAKRVLAAFAATADYAGAVAPVLTCKIVDGGDQIIDEA